MRGQTQHRILRRETDVARIASPMVRELHAYWLGKCRNRPLPRWSDIDPSEISRLLPNLIVAGIEHDPLRVRYRLAGTQIVEFRGEITGHYLGEIPWSAAAGQAVAKEGFALAIASRRPIFSEVEIATRTGSVRHIFAGIWPLAPAPDASIDRCLALEDYGGLVRDELA
ncbi:PAS domain-containing protein [Dongia sp.]|uniref:PAS domain-containing protein n=1 Tax=Dongia sp. TaxID=1977262 RepID=UPI0035ADCDF1